MENNYGRYQIVSELGKGGMATVYLAHDPFFDRDVAVKVLPHDLLEADTFRARFEREAKIVGALENPAIVPVYDFGEDHGQPFIVMRFMSNGSLLNQLDANAQLSLAETIKMVQRMSIALSDAHANGVVHRDLKPENILYDKRKLAYLSDFGVAKLAQASVELTASGVVGTPAYMSPEQAMGQQNIDGRSDIYTLGLIVYEILTGKMPFDATTPVQMMMMHIQQDPPNIRDIAPGLPPGLEHVMYRALSKKSEDRYASIDEFSESLSKVLQENFSEESEEFLATTEMDLGLVACLVHADGTLYTLDKDHVTIGRDPNRDIDISGLDVHKYVSKFHAEIFYDEGVWQLRAHKQARNPTKHNGKLVKSGQHARLESGDEIIFADVPFTFRV